MAKIHIPVSPRYLREVLQSSLELIPSARIHGLLWAPKKSMKCGASRPPLKGAKRSLWLEDGVSFELENEEPRAVSVVCGLLAGLCSNALMERHGELSSRMNVTHAGTRKSAANATKTT
jgi:hypothetical protein